MVVAAELIADAGFPKRKSKIITSDVQRSTESAHILAEGLGVTRVEEKEWLEDGMGEDAFVSLKEYVNDNKKLDALLVVSHLPELEAMVNGFADEFKEDIVPDLPYGAVYIIDTKRESIEPLGIV